MFAQNDNRAELMTARAIRQRCGQVLALARADALSDWRLDDDRLDACAGYVVETIQQNYPDLSIPFHARWRHFRAGGRDLWAELDAATVWPDPEARLVASYDLAIVSVLLDAGAGPAWSYTEPLTGRSFGRSEGLGLASLAMFRAGLFSSDAADPLRVDAAALERLDAEALAKGFQVTAGNPMVGLEGRSAVLRRLGAVLSARAASAGLAPVEARPGLIARNAWARATVQRGLVDAPSLLEDVLGLLDGVWPDRPGAVPGCGDTWRYPGIGGEGEAAGAVPFHKLSQWLTYSLIEPLQTAGLTVADIDGLTGLPEYRNGGLFIDLGVLVPRDAMLLTRRHGVADPAVVAWRALTVMLLDEVAVKVRERLGLDQTALPLAKVLEGGTWSAGRRAARERRSDGGPPLQIDSDGTVF